MRRADPYSTPARRRRIINDVAKAVLRQYCLAACNNVIKFREETRASIILQCAIRRFNAKNKLRRLIFIKQSKAALKIQSIWRMKLAGMLKVRLRKERRLQQATRLALCVQTLYRNRKERLHRIALMVARKLELEKKRNKAALEIQRVFRGALGRRRFADFAAARKAYHLRRKMAAIVIQRQMRRCLAVVVVSVQRNQRRIQRIVVRLKLSRWRKHYQKHRLSILVCQSAIRMYLAKRRVAAYRKLLEQMRLDKMSELRPISPYQIPLRRDPVPTKTMNIQVDLTSNLLCEMASHGPRCVIAWCLENYILHYQMREGYALGAVVQQVVNSVDSLLGSTADKLTSDASQASKLNDDTTAASVGAGDDRVITLAKWDEGHASDVPDPRFLPEDWSQACYGGVDPSGALVTVSVHLLSDRMEVHVSVDNPLPAAASPQRRAGVDYSMEEKNRLVYDFRSRIDIPPVVTSTLIVIVLNCDNPQQQQQQPDLLQFKPFQRNEFKSLTSSSAAVGGSTSAKLKDMDEAKFRFKNALVQVTTGPPPPAAVPLEDTPQPPSPPPPKEDTKGGDIIFDDELSDDSLIEEHLPRLAEEMTSSVRPQTATVVRIVLREPTPPPPDLDYMARRIQFMMRRRWDLLNVAAEYIQSMFYHYHMMHRWQGTVRRVLQRAHAAAGTLQRATRCRQARIKLIRLRKEYRYCPDFSLDEEVNWASFGMLTYGKTSLGCTAAAAANAAVFPAPLIARSVTGSSGTSDRVMFGSSDATSGFFNPVGELLDLIQLPPPPPGCILSCDPLVRLPLRNATEGSVGDAEDDDPFGFTRSINAEVRHCVLRSTMPTRSLDISAVASPDLMKAQSVLNDFVTSENAALNSSFADKTGFVFCSHGSSEYGRQKIDSSSLRVNIAPIYSAIAEKYR